MSQRDSLPDQRAMDAVRKHFRHLGLAGPSVAHVEQVIDALRADGLIREQAAWNRQNLAQGRLRAFICAWRDVRACSDEQSAKDGSG